MGYLSRFIGEICIEPPLRWSEFKDIEVGDVRLEIHKVNEDTDRGTLVVKEAVAIIPWSEDSYKGYNIQEDIQQIVNAAPDHSFIGHITAEGEDAGDIRRYSVEDKKVVMRRAKFTFEDID